MKKIEKQNIPVVIVDDEPVAMVFYNKHRDRVIYMTEKANEDQIIKVIENDHGEKLN